ncbi:hypothetical protein [Sporosarcina sp. FSL K6-5500]|uniref:hypothetical protein n=1 Tax=Sporosarcina sp. FSL K6-5500 TaxID=2921558 RepID=UPI0030F88DDF
MTKKPFKVFSKTAIAAALATSALVPTAVFAAEENVNLSVSDYIVEHEGQLYSVDTATFLEMKAGKVAPTPKFVKTAAGKVYDLNDYLEAKSSNIGATMQDALELLAADSSLEKDVTYGNVEIGEDGKVNYIPAPSTDLKVETVKAINGNQVTVTLTGVEGEVPASAVKVSDSNGAVYAVTSVVAGATEGEYLVNLGTAVDGKGTLTVEVNGTSATKDFDTTLAGLTLDISTDEADSELTADGADNAVITIKALKDGVLDETFTGSVKFQSLKGAKFAKEEVAFDKGIAQVQVTSISSPTAIVDTIIATISSADNAEFVGTQARINISYVPKDANEDVQKKVFINYAESDRASDVYVKFNDKVDFDVLLADWKADKVKFSISNKKTDGSPNNVASTDILDLVKVNDNTIKLALANENALTDNSEVKVEVIDGRTNGIVQDSDISFNLVDNTAPKAVAVKAVDYKTLVAEFTEPVNDEGLDAVIKASTAGNWVLNGHKLDADKDILSIEVGNIINEDGDVSAYDTVKRLDNRHFVTIKLVDKDSDDATKVGVEHYKATGKKNLLQAYNISDYAALTDATGQNKATTQEFEFVTPAVPAAPTVKVTQDSPEQFKVAFSAAVEKKSGAGADLTFADFTIEYQNGFEVDGTTPKYNVMTSSQVEIFKDTNSEYYIELLQDWTQIHETANEKINYYTPGYNNVRITLNANAAKSTRTGVVIETKHEELLELKLDDVSPTFVSAEQVESITGVPQQEVAVVMSEPVKFPTVGTPPVLVNDEGDTASEQQEASTGVPVPTFSFVSADQKTTIDGTLKTNSLSVDDKSFTIEPDSPLAAGEWTVYIRSISDDIGNTSDTIKRQVTILPTEDEVGEAKVIWAQAIDNTDTKVNSKLELQDVVFIQYGTEMSLDALKSNIYTINGKELPEGVSITSTEENYSGDLTGTRVMITLPHTFLGEVAETYVGTVATPHNLNINKRLTDDKGNTIQGKTELVMSYDFDGSETVGDIPALNLLITGDTPVALATQNLADAKLAIENLDLEWDTDQTTTVTNAQTAINALTLPAGVTAVATTNGANVVVTITNSAGTETITLTP